MSSPDTYGTKKYPGKPLKLTKRDKRRVIIAASKGEQSAKQIKETQNIELSTRRVQQILSSTPHLQYKKRKPRPALTKTHVDTRLSWGQGKAFWLDGWHSVIFSDEKKFNLNGPDGNQFYWHDLRKAEKYFSKRPSGGGSIMIWAAFGYNVKTQIVFLKGRQKSEDYINVMRNHLLPNAENLAGKNWIFQQDNASIHVSKYSKKWFSDQNINLLD